MEWKGDIMSGENEAGNIKDMIPSDVDELLQLEREGRLKSYEREPIFNLFDSIKLQNPHFNFRTFLIDNYGFDQKGYTRLITAYSRYRRTGGITKSPTAIIGEEAQRDFAKYLTDTWREARDISLDIVMGWMNKAKEMGYYNEDKKKVDMKKFIEDAVTFYIQYKYSVEVMEEKYMDLMALAKTFEKLFEPQIYRIIALKLYVEFITEVMKLQAKEIPIPENYIIDVKNTVNTFIQTSIPPKLGGKMNE